VLIVARPISSTTLSGYPMILVCSQKPVAPVSWIFRALPDSEPRHIVTDGLVDSDYTERFGIHGSSLIIHKVQPTDYGSYDCHDANRDVFMYNVTVVGEEIVFISKCKKHDVRAINHTYLWGQYTWLNAFAYRLYHVIPFELFALFDETMAN